MCGYINVLINLKLLILIYALLILIEGSRVIRSQGVCIPSRLTDRLNYDRSNKESSDGLQCLQ